jgi:hypothetical protein
MSFHSGHRRNQNICRLVRRTEGKTLARKKGYVSTHGSVVSKSAKIGEDLKAIPYSLEFQPGFDEPMKLPQMSRSSPINSPMTL